MEHHSEADHPDINAEQGPKMSPGRHFEEDPPRIDNNEEWEQLIDYMVLQFEPFYEAKTNTDENAVNRVMSAYRIVLKALSDPEGFDVRCNIIKVKAPKADVQNPVFHRAIEFDLATIAKRKSVPFNKRAVKDTITCYSRVCHWLYTRQPPLLDNSARDQLTTIGINAIEKLWLQENKKADAPKPRKPSLPKKVVQEVWDAIKDLPPPSPGHRSISFAAKQAVRNYLDGVASDEEATGEDAEPIEAADEVCFVPAGFTLDKFLTKETYKENPEYLVLFNIYPFVMGFCDHGLALNCYEGHNEYRTPGGDIRKRTGGSPIKDYMVSDEDNSIYEDHLETVVNWLEDNYESIKPIGNPPPSGGEDVPTDDSLEGDGVAVDDQSSVTATMVAVPELDDLLEMQIAEIHQLALRDASSELVTSIRDRIAQETDEHQRQKLETLWVMLQAQQKPAGDDQGRNGHDQEIDAGQGDGDDQSVMADDDTDPEDDPPSGGEEAPSNDLVTDSGEASVTSDPSLAGNENDDDDDDDYRPEPTEVEKAIAGASNLLTKIINELHETDFEDVEELVEHYQGDIVSRDDVYNALKEGIQTGLIFIIGGSVIGTVNLHNWTLHEFRCAVFYTDLVTYLHYSVKFANAFIEAASTLNLIRDERDEDGMWGGRTIQFSNPRVSLLARKNPKIIAKLRTYGKHMAEYEVASNRDCIYHELLGEDRCGDGCVGMTKFVKMFPSLTKAKEFCNSLSELNSYAVYKVLDSTMPFEDIVYENDDAPGSTSVIKTAYAQFRENHCQLEDQFGDYEAGATDSPYRF
ncbi:hypothetical protein [Paramagnetospirillum caucaseum]|nr:hypothetical protein [Paramagnetospirillum caucaseum]